ncbi:hypothetical protein RvY_18641-2 [Ramazzottius varieornatus]|uniref:Poly [ADP-ribose] polymerase n=1 Tax=Ramazzottius varieornatus TaxID=947166 RepID=A0A1D1W9N5_RAMVA|nr:hypothetical protein RvY_18641-2 [Ramazzottius varieornatus]
MGKRKAPSKVKEEPTDDDWEGMTVAQLKEELMSRKMDTSGRKADLIQRLRGNDESPDQADGKVREEDREEEEDESPPAKKTTPKGSTNKSTFQQAIDHLQCSKSGVPDNKAATSGGSKCKKMTYKIDDRVQFEAPLTYEQVHEDCSFMLNQTNIGHNNNKFYVGQLLERHDGQYDVFTKWGRVSEPGQCSFEGPFALKAAMSFFEKKFKDKTGNAWTDRDNFEIKPKKYQMLEMAAADEEDEEPADAVGAVVETPKKTAKSSVKCSLDEVTQKLVQLIFDTDMFQGTMKELRLDTKKMPLGKLSKAQIAKGFTALEDIEKAIQSGEGNLAQLSSQFYTVIPHDFGRNVPPTIATLEEVQQKFDDLATLGDIEIAQSLQKSVKNEDEDEQHPLDVQYGLLKCILKHLLHSSNDYKVLQKYFDSTKGPSSDGGLKLQNIWMVDREGEDSRFRAHDSLDHRKLLWHGTNVAVVAAILKTGLRIMPHSGGRVGRGIYFASENAKSAAYTRPAGKRGLMFLNEVALGKEYEITRDDSSLKEAPKGHDSVVARGQFEPGQNIVHFPHRLFSYKF